MARFLHESVKEPIGINYLWKRENLNELAHDQWEYKCWPWLSDEKFIHVGNNSTNCWNWMESNNIKISEYQSIYLYSSSFITLWILFLIKHFTLSVYFIIMYIAIKLPMCRSLIGFYHTQVTDKALVPFVFNPNMGPFHIFIHVHRIFQK